VAGIGYEHAEQLAPSDQMLKRYKKGEISWDAYADEYQALIQKRRMDRHFRSDDLDGVCLLCSEATPHHCHRRLAAEFFQQQLGCGVDIIHLNPSQASGLCKKFIEAFNDQPPAIGQKSPVVLRR